MTFPPRTSSVTVPARCGPRQRRAARRSRRGSVYVLVLGVATMVAVVGIGVIAIARSTGHAAQVSRDWDEAGTLATSGVELALGYMNTNTTWRTDATNRAWIGPLTLGRGRIAFTLVDESDGDLANNIQDPVRVYATATVGKATRVYAVQIAPSGPTGLDLLRTAVHGDAGVTTSSTITIANGPLSSNNTVKNTGTLTATVEAASINNSGTINGFVTAPAPLKALPSSAVVTEYSALGTTISYSSLSGGDIQNCVLSAASNPYGSINSAGVYVITVPAASRLRIRNCRIEATLVVKLGLLSSFEVKDAVLWYPPAGPKPSLIVQGSSTGSVTLGGSSGALDESIIGVNFNPFGTPYLGAVDSDKSDKYPAELRGIFHITNSSCGVTLTDNVATIGAVIAEGPITVTSGARPIADGSLISAPPSGYAGGAVMKPVQGTYRWEAETLAAQPAVSGDDKP